MIIRQAKDNDIKNIFEFNAKMYPKKKIESQHYLDFWFSKSSDELSNSILLIDDDNTLSGQILASSISYYFNSKVTKTVWLFDLIVDEKLRKEAWGIDLLLKCMEIHPQSLSTGAGPSALPIHKKLGNSLLGEIRKYIGIINPWYIPFSIKRPTIPISKFPNSVKACHQEFTLIDINKLPKITKPFNENLLEIARDQEFLKWRFFNRLHQYAFYMNRNQESYFVLRSIELKGIRIMEVVDYRCHSLETNFESIYQAVAQVTKSVHLPIVIYGSSLSLIDKILEKHNFKSIGRPRPILGFLKCKNWKTEIENRNFAFITLADSDGETNWI